MSTPNSLELIPVFIIVTRFPGRCQASWISIVLQFGYARDLGRLASMPGLAAVASLSGLFPVPSPAIAAQGVLAGGITILLSFLRRQPPSPPVADCNTIFRCCAADPSLLKIFSVLQTEKPMLLHRLFSSK